MMLAGRACTEQRHACSGSGHTCAEWDATVAAREAPPVVVAGCAAAAIEPIRLVSGYRASNLLPTIPASPSLCRVASAHTQDLAAHPPSGSCKRLTANLGRALLHGRSRSPGNGFENAFMGSNEPRVALRDWMAISGHNEVILNRGIWASHPCNAIGADTREGDAVL